METEKFYVEKINILGNNITQENVIRDALEVDEGDPFNELLHAKSLNNLKSKNIFKKVESELLDGSDLNKKIININIVEKPTGEVMLGAGVGSQGGTVGFSVSENNFIGQGIKLSASLRITEDSIRGNFTTTTPNYKYSGKPLRTNIQSDVTDKMADSGYESTKQGFSFGTTVEQYENLFFSPQFSTYLEHLTADSTASDNLKKQAGDYFETSFSYNIDYDKRNQRWQTSEGYRSKFTQSIPIISDNYAMLNGYEFTKWIDFENDLIVKVDFYGRAKNSMTGGNVRVSERLHLPSKRLRGFNQRAIGPVDGNDYVGGNFSAAVNFTSTLPMIFPSFEAADFKFFIDTANVWGVDYRDNYDDSNKIRSSTGIAVDWFTVIGPLSFSLAQPITKVSTDITEAFQFNLGTTF
jgi:outer membrane protein insertion porin family